MSLRCPVLLNLILVAPGGGGTAPSEHREVSLRCRRIFGHPGSHRFPKVPR